MSAGKSVLTAITSFGISAVMPIAITTLPTSGFVFLIALLASSYATPNFVSPLYTEIIAPS